MCQYFTIFSESSFVHSLLASYLCIVDAPPIVGLNLLTIMTTNSILMLNSWEWFGSE